MTNADIRAILARAEAATPGKWDVGHPGKTGGISVDIMVGKNKTFRWVCQPFEEEDEDKTEARAEDWVFISHSRTDVPALCRDLLAAREALRGCAVCSGCHERCERYNAALGEEVKP